MRFRLPLTRLLGAGVLKPPPRRILPSGWTTTTLTRPFAFGSKPSSADCPCTAEEIETSSSAVRGKNLRIFFIARDARRVVFGHFGLTRDSDMPALQLRRRPQKSPTAAANRQSLRCRANGVLSPR